MPSNRKQGSTRKRNDAAAGEGQTTLLARLAWLAMAAAWLLLAAALVSYHPGDWPGEGVYPWNDPTRNWVGLVGAAVAHRLIRMLGVGVWFAVAAMALWLVAAAMRRTVTQPILRSIGIVLVTLSGGALGALWAPMVGGTPEAPAGLATGFIADQLALRFNSFGASVLMLLCLGVGLMLSVDALLLAPVRLAWRGLRAALRWLGGAAASAWGWLARRRAAGRDDADSAGRRKPVIRRRGRRQEELEIDEDTGGLGGTESFGVDDAALAESEPDAELTEEAESDEEADDADAETEAQPEPASRRRRRASGRRRAAAVTSEEAESTEEAAVGDADAPGAYLDQKQVELDAHERAKQTLREKMRQLPIHFAGRGRKRKKAPPREVDLSGYRFPGLDLLEDPNPSDTEEMDRIVREQGYTLESALKQYRIDGEVVGIDSGPVITLYEVRLAPGTKVAALNAISSDLARALKAQNIRIVANMAGRDTVGVEVPNLKKEKVRMQELMSSAPETTEKMRLPMYLGKDASGEPLIADLTSMPHMLIAGTTGSGKSVCMNAIIMSFLMTRRPDDVKLVLVDPKMVEMSMFKTVPHLMCPVVTEMSKAAAILEWAVTKMDERYELLAEVGVRDIAGYNALGAEEILERLDPPTEAEKARIPKKLPYLVFIIDELADLMMTNKEVENHIVRIAQKARAVGIHLILATQRPQANVVTGLIKSNMPCRVSFKVASGMDSRIVLDQKGAELLLGQGDMLFLSPRTSKLMRAQGSLVDDAEVRAVVKFLKEVATQHFEQELVQIKSPGADGDDEAERDPLFEEAVRIVLQSQRGSVSLLQRRLTVGYSRASRLIEQMADAGFLGEHKGSQARAVLMTLEEYEALKAEAEGDSDELDEPIDPELEDEAFDADSDEALDADAEVVDESEDVEEVEEGEADEIEDEAAEPDVDGAAAGTSRRGG